MKTPGPILIAFLACGCLQVPSEPLSQSMEPVETGAWQAQGGGRLYARDGSPVSTAPAGAVIETGQPLGHPLEDAGGSRLVLLDLYQIAVDERDEMALELDAMNHSMAQDHARYAELERRFKESEAMLEALKADNEQLEVQNLDLAGRLTTAQIRRLEAEKLLLEATLETQRTRGNDN